MLILIDEAIPPNGCGDKINNVFLLYDDTTRLYWITNNMIPWLNGYRDVKWTLDYSDARSEFLNRINLNKSLDATRIT